jgi:precorrin-6B methylase 1
MFTGGSSEKFRIAPDQVQIDTTHFRPQHHVKSAVSATNIAVNRTAVRTSERKFISLTSRPNSDLRDTAQTVAVSREDNLLC